MKPANALAVKQLFALHGWLGMGLGLVLAIICGSGAIAVFGQEIDWLTHSAMRVYPAEKRTTFDAIYAEVVRAYPSARIGWWQLQPGPRFADELSVYPYYVDGNDWGPETRVYVDPYRAEIQGVSGYLTARTFLRAFHYYWFDRTGWGFYLVAAFAFVLLGSTFTGMAIYRRWWRGLFALRIRRGSRIFYSDLHKLCGAWTLLFNCVIGLTAAYYLAEWIWSGSGWEMPTPSLSAQRVVQIVPGTRPLSLDAQVATAHRVFPELRIASIALPVQPNDPLSFDGQATAWAVRDRGNKLLLDPYDGSVVHMHRAEQMPLGRRWVDTVDRLHFGSFAGLFSKVAWCILGLMLPALFISGAWLGLRRAGGQAWRQLGELRNPLNALSLAATAALLAFATFSTVHGVRESLGEQPLQPKAADAR